MRDDRQRLMDILEAINRIEKYVLARAKNDFESNEMLQVWIVYHLQIIGEASAKLSVQFRTKHKEIPWPQIIGLRNVVFHEYFALELDKIWLAVERDLPKLKEKLVALTGC